MTNRSSFNSKEESLAEIKKKLSWCQKLYVACLKMQFELNEKHTMGAAFLGFLIIVSFIQQISVCYLLPRETATAPAFNRLAIWLLKMVRLQYFKASDLMMIQGIFVCYNILISVSYVASLLIRYHFTHATTAVKNLFSYLYFYLSEIQFWVLIIPNVEMWITSLVVKNGYYNINLSAFHQGQTTYPLVIIGLVTLFFNIETYMMMIPAKIYFNSTNGNALRRVRSKLEMILLQTKAAMVLFRILADYLGVPIGLSVAVNLIVPIIYGFDYVFHGKFQGNLEDLYGYMNSLLLLNAVFQLFSIIGIFPNFILGNKYFVLINFAVMPFLFKVFLNVKKKLTFYAIGLCLTAKKNIHYEAIDGFLRRVQWFAATSSTSISNIFRLSYSVNFIIDLLNQEPTARADYVNFLRERGVDEKIAQRKLLSDNAFFEDFMMFLYHRTIVQGFSRETNADKPPLTFLASYIGYIFFDANRQQKAIKNAYYFAGLLKTKSVEGLLMQQIIRILRENELIGLGAIQKKFHAHEYSKEFQLEETHESVMNELETIRRQYIEFYTLVGSSTIDLNELERLGMKLQNKLKEVDATFKSLLQAGGSENLELVYNYANFLSKVKMAPQSEYRHLVLKSQELLNKKLATRKVMAGFLSIEHYLETARNVVAVDVGNEFGKMIKVTHSFANIFGYTKRSLEGEHLNLLISQYMWEEHDKTMVNFTNNDIISSVEEREQLMFYGLTSQKLIIPMQLFLKPELFQGRLCLIGLMNERKRNYTTSVMLTDREGILLNYNKEFVQQVGLPEEDPTFFENYCLWLFAPKLLQVYHPDLHLDTPPKNWRRNRMPAPTYMSQADLLSSRYEEAEEEPKSEQKPVKKERWRATPLGFDTPELMQIFFFRHPRIENEIFKKFMKVVAAKFAIKNSISLSRVTNSYSMEYEEIKRSFSPKIHNFNYEDCEIYAMRVSVTNLDYYNGGVKLKSVEAYSCRKITDPSKREQILSLKAVQDCNYEISMIIEVIANESPRSRVKRLDPTTTVASASDQFISEPGPPSSLGGLQFGKRQSIAQRNTNETEKQFLLSPGTFAQMRDRAESDHEDNQSNEAERSVNSEDPEKAKSPQEQDLNDDASRVNEGRRSSIAESSVSGIPEEGVFANLMSASNLTHTFEMGTQTFRGELRMLQDTSQKILGTEREFFLLTNKGMNTVRSGYETPREPTWGLTLEDGNETKRNKFLVSDPPLSTKRLLPTNPNSVGQYQNVVPVSHRIQGGFSAKMTPNSSFSHEISVDRPLMDRLRSPRNYFDASHNLLDGNATSRQRITEQEEDYEEVKEAKPITIKPLSLLISKSEPITKLQSNRNENPASPLFPLLNSVPLSRNTIRDAQSMSSQTEIQSKSEKPPESSKDMSPAVKSRFLEQIIFKKNHILEKMGEYAAKIGFGKINTDALRKNDPDTLIRRPSLHVAEDMDGSQRSDSISSTRSSEHIVDAIHEKRIPKNVIKFRWFGLGSYVVVAVLTAIVTLELRYTFVQLADMNITVLNPMNMIFSYSQLVKESSMMSLANEGKFLGNDSVARDHYISNMSEFALKQYNTWKGNFSALMHNAFKPTVMAKRNLVNMTWIDVVGDQAYFVTNFEYMNIMTYTLHALLNDTSAINNQNYNYQILRSNIMWLGTTIYGLDLALIEGVSETGSESNIMLGIALGIVLGVCFLIVCLVLFIYSRILTLKEKMLCLFCTLSKESMQKEVARLSRTIEMIFNMDDMNKGERRRRALFQMREGGKRAISGYKRLKRSYRGVLSLVGLFYGIIIIFFVTSSVITYNYIQQTITAFQKVGDVSYFPYYLIATTSTADTVFAHDQKNLTEFYTLYAFTNLSLTSIPTSTAPFLDLVKTFSDPSSSYYTDEVRTKLLSILSGDFCPYVTNSTDDLMTCQSLAKGVSKNGLYSAGKYCADFYGDALASFLNGFFDITLFQPTLDSQEFKEVDLMLEYTLNAMQLLMMEIANNVIRLCNVLQNIQIIIMSFAIVTFAILFIVCWWIFILKLSNAIHDAKLILGLVPMDILTSNVYVKNFFKRGI